MDRFEKAKIRTRLAKTGITSSKRVGLAAIDKNNHAVWNATRKPKETGRVFKSAALVKPVNHADFHRSST